MSDSDRKPRGRGRIILYTILAIIAIFVIAGLFTGNDKEADNNTNLPTTEQGTVSDQTDAPTTSEPTTAKPDKKTEYKASTYKVGDDIPAGEYVVFSKGAFGGYFEISKDSSGDLNSIIANGNFSTFNIVTIKKDEYFKMTSSYAVPIEEVDELDTTQEGMFKVGTHLKAGEYKLAVGDGSITNTGYVEVSSSSRHTLNDIVSNDNFEGEKYVTVKDGQYLKLSNAVITK